MAWNSSRWKDVAAEGIAKALCAVFEVEWESDEALSLIRYAYKTDRAAPMPGRAENVIYIQLGLIQDAPTDWAATSYGTDGKAVLTKTLPLSVLLTFYGNDSEEMSEYARTRLLADTGYNSPRAILRGYKMVPVLPFSSPLPVREPDGGEWRLRSDLRIRLNLLHQDTYDYNQVFEAPELTIKQMPPPSIPMVCGSTLNAYEIMLQQVTDETLTASRTVMNADAVDEVDEVNVLDETLITNRRI